MKFTTRIRLLLLKTGSSRRFCRFLTVAASVGTLVAGVFCVLAAGQALPEMLTPATAAVPTDARVSIGSRLSLIGGSLALFSFFSTVVWSVMANRLHDKCRERRAAAVFNDPVTFFRNHHATDAIGRALEMAFKSAATAAPKHPDHIPNDDDRDRLLLLASRARLDYCEQVLAYESKVGDEIPVIFRVDTLSRVLADGNTDHIADEDWLPLLASVDRIGTDGFADAQTPLRVIRILRDRFARALDEVWKLAYASNDPAAKALDIMDTRYRDRQQHSRHDETLRAIADLKEVVLRRPPGSNSAASSGNNAVKCVQVPEREIERFARAAEQGDEVARKAIADYTQDHDIEKLYRAIDGIAAQRRRWTWSLLGLTLAVVCVIVATIIFHVDSHSFKRALLQFPPAVLAVVILASAILKRWIDERPNFIRSRRGRLANRALLLCLVGSFGIVVGQLSYNRYIKWRISRIDGVRVVLMEFKNKGTRSYDATTSIQSALETLSRKHPGMNLSLVHCGRSLNRNQTEEAKMIAFDHLASIVVWGDYDDGGCFVRVVDYQSEYQNAQPETLIKLMYPDAFNRIIDSSGGFGMYVHRDLPQHVVTALEIIFGQKYTDAKQDELAAETFESAAAKLEKADPEIKDAWLAQVYSRLAFAYGNVGKFGKVEETTNKLVRLDADAPSNYHNLALCAITMKEFSAAASSIEKYDELCPADPSTVFLKAFLEEMRENYVDAIRLYEQRITTDGKQVERAFAYNNLANTMAKQNSKLRAPLHTRRHLLDLFDKAISLEPRIAMFWSNKAMTQLDLARSSPLRVPVQFVEAIRSADRAIECDRYFIAAYETRALAQWWSEDYAAALETCDRTLLITPRNITLAMVRGAVLLRLGRKPEAINQMDEVLAQHEIMLEQVSSLQGAFWDLPPDETLLSLHPAMHVIRAVILLANDRRIEAINELESAESMRLGQKTQAALEPAIKHIRYLIETGAPLPQSGPSKSLGQ